MFEPTQRAGYVLQGRMSCHSRLVTLAVGETWQNLLRGTNRTDPIVREASLPCAAVLCCSLLLYDIDGQHGFVKAQRGVH